MFSNFSVFLSYTSPYKFLPFYSCLYFQLHGTDVIPGQPLNLVCEARCVDGEDDKVSFEIYPVSIFIKNLHLVRQALSILPSPQ